MRASAKRWTAAGVVWLATACGVATAKADVIIDNLSTATGGTDGSNITNAGNIFTIGTTPYALTSVTLVLRDTGGSLTDVGLFSAVGNQPGTELVSFGSFTPTKAGDNQYTLTPLSTVTLAADATYFLIVAYSGAPVLDYTDSSSYSGTGTLDGFASSTNGGASYTPYPLSGGPYQMQIQGTPVPEPSAIALLIIGAVGLAGAGRRRARRNESSRASI